MSNALAGFRRWRGWACIAGAVALAGLPRLGLAVSVAEASAKLQAGQVAEAMSDFNLMAEGDSAQAQLILGVTLINGKDVPRDVAKGVAWLEIASTTGKGSAATKARARKIHDEVAPRLSGADLIRVEQYVADHRSRRSKSVLDEQERARALLYPATPLQNGEFMTGCASDGNITGCAEARRALDSQSTCAGKFVAVDTGPATVGPMVRLQHPDWPTDQLGTWTLTYAAHVDRSGWVCRLRVAEGSGRAGMDREALEAIRTWRFQPAVNDGQPVEGAYMGAFTFKHEP